MDDENGRPSYRKPWRPPSLLHRVRFWLAGIEELGSHCDGEFYASPEQNYLAHSCYSCALADVVQKSYVDRPQVARIYRTQECLTPQAVAFPELVCIGLRIAVTGNHMKRLCAKERRFHAVRYVGMP